MVKPGYKETEIGVIPEDWSCVKLLSICELLNGLTYTPENVSEFGMLVIRSSNIQNNQFDFSDNVYVNISVSPEKHIKKDDIIICVRNGSTTLIGKSAKADKDYPNASFGAFMVVLRGNNNEYIFQLFQQGDILKRIAKNSGATINQITNSDFKSIVVPFPDNRYEQQCIAKSLSDADELIASLEKMIAKKKAIKQGVMQELLTGKRRLPGFSREWRTNRLAELAEFPTTCISLARIDSRDYVGTENMIPNVGGIRDNTIALESNLVREFRKNDILLSNIRPYLHKIWYADKNGGCSNDVLVIRSISDKVVLSQYLFFILSQRSFFDEVMSYAIGTKMPRGDKAVIKAYQVSFPCDIMEQEAIISLLSSMDLDISALNDKLKKAHQIKQGMMQQLLTGNIRLA